MGDCAPEATAKPRLAIDASFSVFTILFFAPSNSSLGLSSAGGGVAAAGSSGLVLQKRWPAEDGGCMATSAGRNAAHERGATAMRSARDDDADDDRAKRRSMWPL